MKILKTYAEVRPFLSKVQSSADKNKSALGFLPSSTFKEQAIRGRLWIAISEQSNDFLGYLLFGGKFPSIKIFQLLVTPENRRKGIASNLVKHIIDFGEENNYLTISARVAADITANRFWENNGFNLVRQEIGRGKFGRKINVRIKDLDTPSLFKIMAYGRSVPSTRIQDLQFPSGPVSKSSIYVLDLNVFFDVVRNRLYRKESSLLIKAGLNNQIRVCVTPEFTKELRKHTKPGKLDPILEFAKEIPTLPQIENKELDCLLPELQALIFPERSPTGKHADKIKSDLVHLAYCIHHRATGFVTREKAIISASNPLGQNYYLEILSPADFFQASEFEDTPPVRIWASYGQKSVRFAPASEEEREEIEQFLISIGVSSDVLPDVWNPGTSGSLRRRIVIRRGDKLVGVASWDSTGRFKNNIGLYLYIDEQTPEAERIIDHVLETVFRDSEPSEPRMILLETTSEQTQTRGTALKRGFVRSFPHTSKAPVTSLTKFTFRGIITKDNWNLFIKDFKKLTGLKLPQKIPTLNEFQNTGITVENSASKPVSILKLFDFETLISPAVVLCPQRTGIILPIRAWFAKDLFERIHHQMDLFPVHEAVLHVEKAYFRYPRKVKLFNRGVPALFYLSGAGGGTKEVIGCARVTYSEVLNVEKVGISLRRQGVLSQDMLLKISDSSNYIHVFTFDNFNMFPTRIPFWFLRNNDLITKANLVTVEPLQWKQFTRLCRCGFGFEEIK